MSKTLFVLVALRTGGSATSLLNLLELYNKRGQKMDLLLLEHEGIFLDRAKQVANLLPEESIISSIRCSKESLRKRGIKAILIRGVFFVLHHTLGSKRATELSDKISAHRIRNYDTVIAYQESLTTEYCQYIPAAKRVAWCHMDYDSFSDNRTREEQQNLYDHYTDIACVSQVVKKSMMDNLKIDPRHISVIYNTIPADYIREKSKEKVDSINHSDFTFLSMGRFVKRKGFDRIVYAASELRKQGLDFTWYIMGDGEELDPIKAEIKNEGIESHLICMGAIQNPFPYLAQADCFVLSSINEAQPMVLNEALTLGIPVISTDFSSSREVVSDEMNGLIVPNSKEGVLDGVQRFVRDKVLQNKLRKGAQEFVYDNDSILKQIDELIK